MVPVFTNYQICQNLNKSGVHTSSSDDKVLDFLMGCLCFVLIAFFGFILFVAGVVIYHNI